MSKHLHRDVPGQVDVGLVLVHPDLGHAQSVPPGVVSYVAVVRLLHPGDVSHPGTGQHLHAAPTEPHLQGSVFQDRDQRNRTNLEAELVLLES